MDESIDVVLCARFCDSLHALNVDIEKTEVLGGIVLSNQVKDHVRMSDGFFDGLRVSQVEFYEADSTKVACDLKMSLSHIIAVRYDYLVSSSC